MGWEIVYFIMKRVRLKVSYVLEKGVISPVVRVQFQVMMGQLRSAQVKKYNFHLVSISSTFLRTNFSYEHCFSSRAFSSYVLALAKNLYEKRAQKTLMKLTSVCHDVIWHEWYRPGVSNSTCLTVRMRLKAR